MVRPTTVEGGCLCAAVRYTITFPATHDFRKNVSTCQCEQCRKQTGSLISRLFRVPRSGLVYSPSSASAIKTYSATPGIKRTFCGTCGGYLSWEVTEMNYVAVSTGSLDKDVLLEHGNLIAYSEHHIWCRDEIKGVTDTLPGERWFLDDDSHLVNP